MITSADGTTQREPEQRQVKYLTTAFEVAQDLAEQLRVGSAKISVMPPEIAAEKPFSVDVNPTKRT